MADKKKKEYVFHTQVRFKSPSGDFQITMQVYQVGVYAIINNDPGQQITLHPDACAKAERKIKRDFDNGKISDLTMTNKVTVREVNGLWSVDK